MSEKLYNLLPAIYRQRDEENSDKPLAALLETISEQIEILENDMEELYSNWFIETCKQWVVPYIGDLIGVKGPKITDHANFSQRAWVSNNISHVRRKGTLAMLEQLAHDITDWNVRAVEFFKLLQTTQNLNHLNENKTVDMKKTDKLELIDSPFETITHNVDIRHIANRTGRYNIPNIGLFFWRLQTFPVSDSPAFDHGNGKFSFNPLGYDMQLYNSPITEKEVYHIAEEMNLPSSIRRRELKNNLKFYYGDDRSISIKIDGSAIHIGNVIVSNLTGWKNRPRTGKVALDPVLGRILFPKGMNPTKVHVDHYYGFSSQVGSVPFKRKDDTSNDPEKHNHGTHNANQYYIIKNKKIKEKLMLSNPSLIENPESGEEDQKNVFSTIGDAVAKWKHDDDGGNDTTSAVFEIMDSEVYDEPIEGDLELKPGTILQIRSKEGQRPVLKLNNPLKISSSTKKSKSASKESKIIIDGLLITELGKSKNLECLIVIDKGDYLDEVTIRNCTLVPKNNSGQKSLELKNGNNRLQITIDHSIVGRIDLLNSEASLNITDSIVDGKSIDPLDNNGSKADDNKTNRAISCHNLSIENATVFGNVNVQLINLARNTIFTDKVHVQRSQQGIVKFSYFPKTSKMPKQYKCISDSLNYTKSSKSLSSNKITPVFVSKRYGDPAYAQLDANTPKEISEGADNREEIGVFNHLHQASRINNFKLSLDNYLRSGMEAGIFFVT